MQFLKWTALILFANFKSVTSNDGDSSIHKEFDFPTIFYTNAMQIKSPPPESTQSAFKPLIHLKQAMGPLPAKLPPIFYHHPLIDHGHFGENTKHLFTPQMQQSQNPPEMLMEQLEHPTVVPVIDNFLSSSNLYQQPPVAIMQAQHPIKPPVVGQLPSRPMSTGSQSMMIMKPQAPSSGMRSPQNALMGHSKGRPGMATSARPGAAGARPVTPPDFDYTEENLWLTGGIYIAAFVLKALGADVQFQGPGALFVGKRKREASIDISNLVWEDKSNDEQCLAMWSCQYPFIADITLDILDFFQQKNSSGHVTKLIHPIEFGKASKNQRCEEIFNCKHTFR